MLVHSNQINSIPQSSKYGFLIKIVRLIQSVHYELFKAEIRSQENAELLKK